MVVLDTDILIGLLRNNGEAVTKIQELEQQYSNRYTTSISSYELLKGAYQSSNPSKGITQVSTMLQSLTILDFDFNSSKISAQIFSYLKKKGVLTSSMDQMIAAIAISQGKILVTRNAKHYQHIPHLKIEEW
ncbi:MAG TPA: type II toxin-antitoxin system VapC family toxin [Candidatus Nanoarchaeia archaeon]|nr:type II toxin-antitoxin system VapC family toxin [Candidatus Nanoarchaeia archaeon]